MPLLPEPEDPLFPLLPELEEDEGPDQPLLSQPPHPPQYGPSSSDELPLDPLELEPLDDLEPDPDLPLLPEDEESSSHIQWPW